MKRVSNLGRAVIWGLVAIVVVVGGMWGYRQLDATVKEVDVLFIPSSIPADGSSSSMLEIRLISRFGNRLNTSVLPAAPTVTFPEGRDLVRIVPMPDSLHYRVFPHFETGTLVAHVTIPGMPIPIEARLELTTSLADRNHNGYPDVMELTSESDRTAFRRWFTTIALAQATHLDDGWTDRDCAGLARYAYREALKVHDNAWRARRQWLVTGAIPDVRKYNYPRVPIVGTRLFNAGRRAESADAEVETASFDDRRPRGGGFCRDCFSDFAEAARLKDNSMSYLSRDPSDALPGDILLYLNDTDSRWPYHVMIYLGNGATVYHTGPDGADPGRVKRLTLAQLAQHPNPRWHPVEGNRYFLGFYRWNILG